ncbi:MAG: PfkB family carbohydrate kinase [Planctomycetota bacterium]
MSLLVVGTLAYDSVETPAKKMEEILGGAATHFAVAASFFGPVRLVGVVGEDFRNEDRTLLENHGVDLEGLTVAEGRTFRWSCRYLQDMNVRETLDTQLNVFADYSPSIPESYEDSRFVFLANAPPALQAHVVDQLDESAFVVMDTMNLWIQDTWEDLVALLKRVDMVILNDEEARAITQEHSLIRAGRRMLEFGPKAVVVKKGEHGAFLWSRDSFFAIPAYPVEQVVDPTGAGDSFAGGVMGYLASVGSTEPEQLKRAMVYGSVVASFNVEDFSLHRFQQIGRDEIDARYREFLSFTATAHS